MWSFDPYLISQRISVLYGSKEEWWSIFPVLYTFGFRFLSGHSMTLQPFDNNRHIRLFPLKFNFSSLVLVISSLRQPLWFCVALYNAGRILTYFMEKSPSWEANWFEASLEIPSFYGTRRFITAFTSARYMSLSWASSIQPKPPYTTSWRSALIYYYLNIIWLTPGGSSTAHIWLTPRGSSTAHIRLTPGGSSTAHIYTQTVNRTQRTDHT
jgi:hypothetical protein